MAYSLVVNITRFRITLLTTFVLIIGRKKMVILIWGGAAVSIVGLIGLLFSMYKVASAKKNTTSDEDLRVSIRAAMPLNLASLFLSVLGLMSVTIGVLITP
jgi:hypothetical protein